MQIDQRRNIIRNEAGVIEKFGVAPKFIPDYLALVGDAADGYPGIKGLGSKTAASLINRFGAIEKFPRETLSDTNRELALLFKTLATLRIDAPLGKARKVENLRWKGATPSFDSVAAKMASARLLQRVHALESRL